MSKLSPLLVLLAAGSSEASPGCGFHFSPYDGNLTVPADARFLCGGGGPPLVELELGAEVTIPSWPCARCEPPRHGLRPDAGYVYDVNDAWRAYVEGRRDDGEGRDVRELHERLRVPLESAIVVREIVSRRPIELTKLELRELHHVRGCWALPEGFRLEPGTLYLFGKSFVRAEVAATEPRIPVLEVRRGPLGGACGFFIKEQGLVMEGPVPPTLWFKFEVRRARDGKVIMPETVGDRVAVELHPWFEPGALHVLEYRAFDFAGRESAVQRVRFDP